MNKQADPLVAEKLTLIDHAIECHKVQTFADLGGVWGVLGGYSLHALERGMESGILVDKKADEVKNLHPSLQTITANFALREVASQIKVDCIFLFDVLLHQIQPNWDYVLRLYRDSAKIFLIYNQQWVGTKNTVRLPDLGEDAFFIETTAEKGKGSASGYSAEPLAPFIVRVGDNFCASARTGSVGQIEHNSCVIVRFGASTFHDQFVLAR